MTSQVLYISESVDLDLASVSETFLTCGTSQKHRKIQDVI